VLSCADAAPRPQCCIARMTTGGASAAVEQRARVVRELFGVPVEKPMAGVRIGAHLRVGQVVASRRLFSVIMSGSLSPASTSAGCVIAARRDTFDGSGIPQRANAASWASCVASSVG
jgi:hypothetical protein